MTYPELAVTGVGNAIVDILSESDDSFLIREGFAKGSMSLVDAARALSLTGLLSKPKLASGGSAGNTIAGLATLGSKAGYIGKVASDELGRTFGQAIRAEGVLFPTAPSVSGTPTARCVVLVTPDAQRTMCTYLGACVELGPEDIDVELIQSSRITYLEGYLWDPPKAKQAFLVAARSAHAAKRRVSLSLSDSFCVARHRESLLDFVKNHVDVLFANESELISLYQTVDVQAALASAKSDCPLVAVTCGANGCLVAAEGCVVEVPAEPVVRVVDTTGAGDLFAAGFLHGLASGYSVRECAVIGGVAAAEVISHFGARPLADLGALARQRLAVVA
jgi:sugar/nucleoside kinase (ribokinase family)